MGKGKITLKARSNQRTVSTLRKRIGRKKRAAVSAALRVSDVPIASAVLKKNTLLSVKSKLHLAKSKKRSTKLSSGMGLTKAVSEVYHTKFGRMLHGRIEDALTSPLASLKGKVNLIVTSPPFPLVRKKKYGNETGEVYLKWLETLAKPLSELLSDDGSIVIEIGNAWEEGAPVMSTLPLEALLAFKKAANLNLCQHVICHNPARLPSPAAWVNVKRVRLKDSFTHVWWMSRTKEPKADNRRVLNPYSKDMRRLLSTKKYNSGQRPSGHVISETGFLKDHGGAISPNVLELNEDSTIPGSLLKFSGTKWDEDYRSYCAENKLPSHPARMQALLSAFFVKFLTDEGDLVLDPFAGSNTTGAIAESLGRKWIGVEANLEYAKGSLGRFIHKQT